MSLENLLVMFFGSLSLLVAIYIGIRGKSRVISLLYAFIGFITGPVWAIAIGLFRESNDIGTALFWDQIIYLVSITVAPLFYLFSTYFPRKKKLPIYMIVIAIAGFIYFLIEIYFGKNFIKEIILNDSGNSIEVGYAYVIWFFWFVFFMTAGQITILKEFFSLEGTEKEQVKYLAWGAILPALGTIPTNALLPMFGIYQYIWIGPYFMIGTHIITSYGITRSRFRNIRSIIGIFLKAILGFCYLLLALTLLQLVFLYLVNQGLTELVVVVVIMISVLLGMPAFFISQIVDNFVEKLVADTNKMKEAKGILLRKIQTELNLLKLTNLVSSYLPVIFGTDNSGIVVLNSEANQVICESTVGFEKLNAKELIPFVAFWDEYYGLNEPIILSELEYILRLGLSLPRSKSAQKMFEIMEFMDRHNIEIIVPLSKKLNIAGLIFVGRKKKKIPYWVEDIRKIRDLSERISVSISRALLYREISDFNETLKYRVNKATQKIKDKNKILRENLRRERDLIDIMGHELRTPLTIVRNCFDLILVNLKANNHEGITSWVEKGISGTKRGIDILESMLTTTKIDKNKIQVVMEKASLSELAKSTIDGLTREASAKGLEIKHSIEDRIFVYADSEKLLQIINNLISNAIKFTDNGYIELVVGREADNAILKISDTGVGINKDDIKNLGKKFFRSNQYIGQDEGVSEIVRPGGTGLGLYVVFNYVKLLRGKIKVESKLGKGTTFKVIFPLYEGQRTKSSITKGVDRFEKLKKEV